VCLERESKYCIRTPPPSNLEAQGTPNTEETQAIRAPYTK